MIEKLKQELRSVEEGIEYRRTADTAWHPAFPLLLKKRKLLKRAIRRLEKLEEQIDEATL